MKLILGLILSAAGLAMPTPTARDYYNELKQAGALNHYLDEYACFIDEGGTDFSVVAKADDIIAEMKEAGVTDTKVMDEVAGTLLVERFVRGVSANTRIYQAVANAKDDFSYDYEDAPKAKIRFSINWATGRYRLKITIENTKESSEEFGKCELIHPPK